jgi:hypothetical protein
MNFRHPYQKPRLGTPLNRNHPLAKGLVGSWLFNEGAGNLALDSSGNGNNGTLTNMNAGTYNSGWCGGALAFDGVVSHVKITPAPLNARTIVIRFFYRGVTSGDHYFYLIGNDIYDDGCELRVESGHLQGYMRPADGSYHKFYDIAYASPNTWENYAVTFDVNRHTISVYKNGVIVGIDSTWDGTFVSTLNNNMYIGCESEEVGSQRYFNGLISSVSIYNRALSTQEIAQLYQTPYCMYDADLPMPVWMMGSSLCFRRGMSLRTGSRF